jgi:hypothetical protein
MEKTLTTSEDAREDRIPTKTFLLPGDILPVALGRLFAGSAVSILLLRKTKRPKVDLSDSGSDL